MPLVEVDIDIDSYLDEASEDALRMELDRRAKRRPGWQGPSGADPHPWTDLGLAEDLRTAFYARNASRFEDLLRALDRRAAGASA